jgi:hypothetical protein
VKVRAASTLNDNHHRKRRGLWLFIEKDGLGDPVVFNHEIIRPETKEKVTGPNLSLEWELTPLAIVNESKAGFFQRYSKARYLAPSRTDGKSDSPEVSNNRERSTFEPSRCLA